MSLLPLRRVHLPLCEPNIFYASMTMSIEFGKIERRVSRVCVE